MERYDKIKLPYSYDALEPYIDAETVEIHYTKHLQSYVDKLNKILEGYDKYTNEKSLEEIIKNVYKLPKKIRYDVIDQGGGVLNHNLYFSILSGTPKSSPEGPLLQEINESFGNLEALKEKVNEVSISQFGSGYGWLVKDKHGKLKILNTLNQDSPFILGLKPILTIDVWEHAYYLKYKNLRADYVKNIWNVIDWGMIENLYNEK